MKIQDLKRDFPKLGALAASLRNGEEGTMANHFVWRDAPQGAGFWSEVNCGIGLQEKEDALPQKRILILGDARHGKDTLADMLCDNSSLRSAGSSQTALDVFLFDVLKNKHNLSYSSKEEAYEDRINHRKIWYDEICLYNSVDRLKLVKDILKVADIYVGLRNHLEVESAISESVFDHIIGVYDYRKPRESNESNSADVFKYSDFVIMNNGSLSDLESKVINVILKVII